MKFFIETDILTIRFSIRRSEFFKQCYTNAQVWDDETFEIIDANLEENHLDFRLSDTDKQIWKDWILKNTDLWQD